MHTGGNLVLASVLALGLCAGGAATAAFAPKLLAVELESGCVAPGDVVPVTYWWKNAGSAPADSDYGVFVHLRANLDDSGAMAGGDYLPATPTHRWRAGDVVAERQVIRVPSDFAPGDYHILVGMFGAEGRLALRNPGIERPTPGGPRYEVGSITVRERGSVGPTEPRRFDFAPVDWPKRSETAAQSVTIASGRCRVRMDRRAPRALEYDVDGASSTLGGSRFDDLPDIALFAEKPGRRIWAGAGKCSVKYTCEAEADRVVYSATVADDGIPAATFDLTFRLSGDSLRVDLGAIREFEGYKLLCVRTPALVSVDGSQKNASLVITTNSGRLIPVAKCPGFEKTHSSDWFNPAPMGMVYDDALIGMVTAPSIDDHLVSMVREYAPGQRYGGLAVELVHRVSQTAGEPGFVVQAATHCEVALLRDVNGDKRCDWVDGAAYWRDRVRAKLNPLYKDALIYKIFLDAPGSQDPTTFDQALELMRRINRLTDGARQVVYLVGWQHNGHDTGYPDVYAANERIGGMDELKRIIEEGAKLNCIVSFHDNYDDAYMDGPGWDPSIIAKNSDGSVMKGGWWGHQSYIISQAKYVESGAAARRVERTLGMYPVRKSYHIDVLTAVPSKYDFDPQRPSGANENLKAKWRIIEEFNKRGVDVTSEGMVDQFVGRIGHAWHLMRSRDAIYPVESRIPLVPFMYHGKTTWGGGGAGPESLPVLDALTYGATFGCDLSKGSTDDLITDMYYLIALPARLLRALPMTAYAEDGDARVIHYGPDSVVEVNENARKYSVTLNGRVIAQDYSTWAPVSSSEALVYSRSTGEIYYPVPEGWTDASRVRAYDLLAGSEAQIDPVIDGGRICVKVEGGHPYRVTYAPSK